MHQVLRLCVTAFTVVALAYLAGVVDSDGCLAIGIDTWRVRKFGIAPDYSERVTISQNKTQAVDLAQELFGGNVRIQKPRGGISRYPLYRWQITNRKAALCVAALFPYLRLKRDAAQMLLDLRAIKDRGREANTDLGGPRIRIRNPATAAAMAALAAQIREFNSPTTPRPLREQEHVLMRGGASISH